MRTLTRWALATVATAMATTPAASFAVSMAMAENSGQFLPLNTVLRRCDFSTMDYYDAVGTGRPTATVRSSGGQVTADVQMVLAKPNATYQVRLIQMPRESWEGCHAGGQGTAVLDLRTDGAGAGAVTLSAPLMSGATGAWVAVDLPQPGAQGPAEFYSSDLIAKV
ncbi:MULTISPECIES: hypothetical protein [Mycobacteriaceae]|uniref:hypothetical protein n=1 Tax=Mycobacteriaceae TaxID=1762 RepID=UPI0007FFEBE8|nr:MULTISPECIES: hypothetical protein [Mycobacteriaceae]MCK0174160.1 hypothetical protein [Mycolicibacterium sp. F2034L]OBB62010.1 hypothetical protein A5757_05275 [Mycobacterium sp. 852013-51886_SCH5428379]